MNPSHNQSSHKQSSRKKRQRKKYASESSSSYSNSQPKQKYNRDPSSSTFIPPPPPKIQSVPKYTHNNRHNQTLPSQYSAYSRSPSHSPIHTSSIIRQRSPKKMKSLQQRSPKKTLPILPRTFQKSKTVSTSTTQQLQNVQFHQYHDKHQRNITNVIQRHHMTVGNASLKHQRSNTAPTMEENICYSDIVLLYDGREGKVKFVGTIGYGQEIWFGLHLKYANGKHNGSNRGRIYFKCPQKHGTFVNRSQIQSIVSYRTGVRFSIFCRIQCQKGYGIIKFIGEIQDANNTFKLMYGIALDKQNGKCNGDYCGVYYFNCPPFHGTFLYETQIIIAGHSSTNIKQPHMQSSSKPKPLPSYKIMPQKINQQPSIPPPPNESMINIKYSDQQNRPQSGSPHYNNNGSAFFNHLANTLSDDMSSSEEDRDSNSSDVSLRSLDVKTAIHNTNIDNIVARMRRETTSRKLAKYDLRPVPNQWKVDNLTASPMKQHKSAPFTQNGSYQAQKPAVVKNIAKFKKKRTKSDPKEHKKSRNTENKQKTYAPALYPAYYTSPDKNQFQAPYAQFFANVPPFPQTHSSPMVVEQTRTSLAEDVNTRQIFDPLTPQTSAMTNFIFNNNSNVRPMINMLPPTAALPPEIPMVGSGGNVKSSRSQMNRLPKSGAGIEYAPLKDYADSPFDIRTSHYAFAKCAEVIAVGCNNPRGLFKVLKGMCTKLRMSNPKYRIIDPLNPVVQRKLFSYQGTEEFLRLLGFEPDGRTQCWLCPEDQPPICVLHAGIDVCTNMIIKCNEDRTAISSIRKFSRHTSKIIQDNLLKMHQQYQQQCMQQQPVHHAIHNSPNLNISKNQTKILNNQSNSRVNNLSPAYSPLPSSIDKNSFSSIALSTLQKSDSNVYQHLSNITSIPSSNSFDIEDQKMNNIPNNSSTISNATIYPKGKDTAKEEEKFDDDLDGINDRFRLREIIWCITHHSNKENKIRNVLLLCYPTFTTGKKLLNMLEERFFCAYEVGDDHSAQWEMQVKVVNVIKTWLKHYFSEDFLDDGCGCVLDLQLEDFVQRMTQYFEARKNSCADSQSHDEIMGCRLPEMLTSTIEIQYKLTDRQQLQQMKSLRNMKSNKLLGTVDIDNNKKNLKKKNMSLTKVAADIFLGEDKLFQQLMNSDPCAIAIQITIIDFELYKKIGPRECLEKNWRGDEKEIKAPNICRIINQFNRFTNWVQMTILYAKNTRKRVKVIKKWMDICKYLFDYRNFQSLAAVFSALTTASIHRLKVVWKSLPAKYLVTHAEFQVIFKPANSQANLRKVHREAHAPMVPYTGIFIQDLFRVDDIQANIKDDGSVNFSKLLRMYAQIEQIILLQNTSYTDMISVDGKLRQMIEKSVEQYQHLTLDEIYELSTEVAIKDDPKLKKKLNL